MADIAVNLVVDKLFSLLTSDTNLLRCIHKEVADIRDELESMQAFLRDADMRAEQEDASSGLKMWVKQVRELAYQVEDVVDKYTLHASWHQDEQRFLHKMAGLINKLRQRHQIATEIQALKNSVREARERAQRYSFFSLELAKDCNSTWHNPRVASLFVQEAELVGIETPRNELVSKLVEVSSKTMVISVVGMGGLGKTTVAKKVYDDQRVTKHFDCRAWINVSQSYKMEQLLRTMMKELQSSRNDAPLDGIETMESLKLLCKLREYLADKRYVVVLDDIWDVDFWEFIKFALPDNVEGSRILITTRNENVVPSARESSPYCLYKLPYLSPEKALELFHKRVFQSHAGNCPEELLDLSRAIVERCEGLPLAIVTIGGVLATKDKCMSEWQKLYDGLRSALAINQSITRILSLSYHDLPYYLKICFMYFGLFPEDKSISCQKVIRLWIAEGFIKEKPGMTLEDIAQGYLTELIHRSLVQVAKFRVNGRARGCRIHDLLLEIIYAQSGELSFYQVSADNFLNLEGIGRRISIHDKAKTKISVSTNSVKTRSVLLFCIHELPKSLSNTIFTSFKLLRVLDFEGAPLDKVPDSLGNLSCLRYLSLKKTKVKMVPRSMGKLQYLETLDLRKCPIYDLSIEMNTLQNLRYLASCFYDYSKRNALSWLRGMKIHGSIPCLKALQTLRYVEVDHNIGLIKDLESLTQLRKLGIHKLERENGLLLCNALEKMSHLHSLSVASKNEEEFLDLQSITHPPPLLQHLELNGPLAELPLWVFKLRNLMTLKLRWSRLEYDPTKVLQVLPNLLRLVFIGAYNGEQLHFRKGYLERLKNLQLSDLPRLKRLIIDEGALSALEDLHVGRVSLLKEVPSGIHYMRKNLKTLCFKDIERDLVLGMLPDGGQDFWKIEHVPTVLFSFTTRGEWFNTYKLGDKQLLEHLKN